MVKKLNYDPYTELALAIILNAINEARWHKNKEAVRFLLSEACELMCDGVGIQHRIIINFVYAGCPGQKNAFDNFQRIITRRDP